MKHYLSRYRPAIGSVTLAILLALYMVAIFNRTFLERAVVYFQSDYAVIVALVVALLCIVIAILVAISLKYLTKPLFILLILAGSVTSWFTDQFGTIIDKDMIINAVETTSAEANNLLTMGFFRHLLLTGLVPIVLIIWVKIRHRPFLQKVFCNLAVIMPCLVVAFGCLWAIFGSLSSTVREHRDIVKVINPFVPIGSVAKYVFDDSYTTPLQFRQIGLDAHVVEAKGNSSRPRVLVLVAGETARAKDFSLQGYNKPTNPELEKRNVLYFGNTSSCGTATARSLPCMFSSFTRAEYNEHVASATETLPDVLAHAGIAVEWWDNNTGSKDVADRIKNVIFYGGKDPKFCIKGECQDGIMLEKLDAWLDNVKGDSVLILHQLGSHGPAYFKRYPDAFRRFTPDCRKPEFSDCTEQEIINAYDNTIVYTDYFLSSIIDKLQAREKHLDGALFYMSDHGESLGENGVYLHGLPYAFAPKEQTHIPFVLWMSPAFSRTMGLNVACLRKDEASRPLSHDNLFPSVLTMMNVETTVKDAKLDMFAACQSRPATPAGAAK